MGVCVKVAVAHGLGNARKLLNNIREGKADYHFIEIMACSGGCVNGGGQPIVPSRLKWILMSERSAQKRYIRKTETARLERAMKILI